MLYYIIFFTNCLAPAGVDLPTLLAGSSLMGAPLAMALSPHHHPARSESNHHAPTTPATHTSEQKQHVSLGPLFSPPGRAEPQYEQKHRGRSC